MRFQMEMYWHVWDHFSTEPTGLCHPHIRAGHWLQPSIHYTVSMSLYCMRSPWSEMFITLYVIDSCRFCQTEGGLTETKHYNCVAVSLHLFFFCLPKKLVHKIACKKIYVSANKGFVETWNVLMIQLCLGLILCCDHMCGLVRFRTMVKVRSWMCFALLVLLPLTLLEIVPTSNQKYQLLLPQTWQESVPLSVY